MKLIEFSSETAFWTYYRHDPAALTSQEKIPERLRLILKKAFVIRRGNARIDAAWLWTKSETVDRVHFTFKNALQLMREYPILCR